MKKHSVVLAFLLMAPHAYCADYSGCFQKNTMEMSFCFSDIRAATENTLKNEEERIIHEISQLTLTPNGEEENKKLKKQTLASFMRAQEMWRAYRDSDCKFIYNANQYGSMRNVFEQQCLIVRTEQRIDELKNWQNWEY
jgi:uncharacterized protein YecT (DUF1311 family)